jgi:hypothetical protein
LYCQESLVLTHAPSWIFKIRGAYCDTGRIAFGGGDPKPDIPPTLYLLEGTVPGGTLSGPMLLLRASRLEALREMGGVLSPLPKTELRVEDDSDDFASVLLVCELPFELSVLKLALLLLRRSFKNEGAIIDLQTRG